MICNVILNGNIKSCITIVSCRNNLGQSVRHLAAQEKDNTSERILYILHAVGAPRCISGASNCTDGCSALGTYNGQIPPVPPSAQVSGDLSVE